MGITLLPRDHQENTRSALFRSIDDDIMLAALQPAEPHAMRMATLALMCTSISHLLDAGTALQCKRNERMFVSEQDISHASGQHAIRAWLATSQHLIS